jgi:hypothetical protein
MNNDDNDRIPVHPDQYDIEEILVEARRAYDPSPKDRWDTTVQIVKALLLALPGSRVSSGEPRRLPGPVDYLPPTPNTPVTVFGPDGRFIVTFLEEGRWIEADGRIASTAGVIEGGPESVAESMIRTAGVERPRPSPLHRAHRRPRSDGLPRQLLPTPTFTWRDNVDLPDGLNWDEHTPASICRESQTSRLIAVAYDPDSCTFANAPHPRWGIESLRIPDFIPDRTYPSWMPAIDPIHVGDCLLTIGEKHDSADGELRFEDAPAGVRLWFPQRVVHVEPEGATHLRVWLAWDRDVANDNLEPNELPDAFALPDQQPRILTPDEARAIWPLFQLTVFCERCGNRARPILYGLPASEDPSYVSLGGCIIEPNQPQYTCLCGHQWTDLEWMSW